MIFRVELYGATYQAFYVRDTPVLTAMVESLNQTAKPGYFMRIEFLRAYEEYLDQVDFKMSATW